MRTMPARSSNAASALSGRHALVTGASSGLRVDFARELAGRGANIRVVALDLNDPGAPDRDASTRPASGPTASSPAAPRPPWPTASWSEGSRVPTEVKKA
jgi:hypothetical protein